MRKRKREYRYRDHSGGVTTPSVKALQHLPKVGLPSCVRGYCYRSATNKQLAVLVRGNKGSARFEGFCWGYGGEGPRGLRELFNALRIPEPIAVHIAHEIDSPDWSKAREYWRLILHPNGGYDLYLYDREGNVSGHRKYTLQMEAMPVQLRLAM
jgi:hypothetical protein